MNIDVALGLSDPALVTRWFVNFPDLNDPLEVIAQSIEIALPKVGAKSRRGQGRNINYTDVEEIDAISLQVYETWDFKATRYFNHWYSLVKDENDNYGVPALYKKNFWAHLWQREVNEPVATFTFERAWPLDRSGFSLNYEDDAGRIIKTVQLQIDRAKFKLQGS